ncbi:MAG: lipoprotein insertase outer membrane protein LolB [Gallionella sp.]|nr:lipoprotein insertase outer membrane protein LolB [Gallionella sp.]
MRWMAVLLASALSGCALLPPAPAPVSRPAQPELAPFALNGRISVKYNGSRDSAGLRWTHTVQSDEILLLTPLGQTAARVYSDARHTTLDEGDKHYENESAESLMHQVLGWYLPLSQLHHWLLGMTEAGSPAQIERDANGQITVLHQDGWEVRYLSYADTKPDSLPKRMQLIHEGLQVQLLIDEWEWNLR